MCCKSRKDGEAQVGGSGISWEDLSVCRSQEGFSGQEWGLEGRRRLKTLD